MFHGCLIGFSKQPVPIRGCFRVYSVGLDNYGRIKYRKTRLIKTLEQMVSDELLKRFIASNTIFFRKIHSIQMKELVSCKYLTLRSAACISFSACKYPN